MHLIQRNSHIMTLRMDEQMRPSQPNEPMGETPEIRKSGWALSYPIIDHQVWNAPKFLFVVGNQGTAERKRVGGDQHVE
jgi:hypothetical protein